MARKVFFSFHFKEDHWRTSQVRNIGSIEGNKPIHDNDWEDLKRNGFKSIQYWIDSQLFGKSCVVVLIGNKTADRDWIKYEIRRGWELRMGVLGIYIHTLLDHERKQSLAGNNPFTGLPVSTRFGEIDLGRIAPIYAAPYFDSSQTYNYIKFNIASWVEDAIQLRQRY